MIYRATYKENPVIYTILVICSVETIWLGFADRDPYPILIGILLAAFFAALRLRLYVRCTEEYLEARGLSWTRRIAWSELAQVESAERKGYVAERLSLHGPSSYTFSSKFERMTINFKFFSFACIHDVMGRAEAVLPEARAFKGRRGKKRSPQAGAGEHGHKKAR